MQRQQRPQPLPRLVVVNKIQRDLNPPARLGHNLLLDQRHARFEGFAQRPAQHRRAVEDLARMQPQDASLLDEQKPPRRLRNQHRPAIAGEQQDSILQIAQNLIQVLLQRGKDFFHVAHALAEALDFAGDADGRILPGSLFFLGRKFAGRTQKVELAADLFHRAQCQVARAESHHQRSSQHKAHQRQRSRQPRRIEGPEQRGAHPHVHRHKRLSVALQRHHHVIDPGRPVDLPHQLQCGGVAQLLVVWPRRQRLVFVVWIGAQHRHRLAVADVDVVHRERVAVDRFHHRLQRLVVAHRLCCQAAQLGWIVGVHPGVPQPRLQRVADGKLHLVGHHPVGVVRLLHGGMQKLDHVDQRQDTGNQENHAGNGQNEFGLQSHGQNG